MTDYKDMYFHIFNKLTALTEEIKELQRQMEEMYINSEEDKED